MQEMKKHRQQREGRSEWKTGTLVHICTGFRPSMGIDGSSEIYIQDRNVRCILVLACIQSEGRRSRSTVRESAEVGGNPIRSFRTLACRQGS